MRRQALVLGTALVVTLVMTTGAARAHSTPQIRAQKAHARQVLAEVNQIGNQLTVVEGRAQNAQNELALVEASLQSNTYKLHVARTNFRVAQKRLMSRIYSDYVYGKPSSLDVIAGAKSITDLINRSESAQAVSDQDSELGKQALHFERAVQQRQNDLNALKAKRAATVKRLAAEKHQVEAALARQKQLLSSIKSSIHTLQVQEAQREARIRAEEQARLQQLAAERAAAARAARQQHTGLVGSPVTVPIPVGTGAGHPQAAQIALQYLGVPYVWGGASPSGFDCSGLVMYVYAQLGISLPHYTVSQWDATLPISQSDAQPGDLVFFNGLSHVGIYLGNGQMVDAPHTGSVVRVESIYGFGSIDGFRRVP
jgi:cell wall-associated NlpC family hydrolase